MTSFDELIHDAAAAPITGWDFSWLDGRATEERPSWHYSELLAQRYAACTRVLDAQCGGGELLAKLPTLPSKLVVTEGYAPNISLAADRLRPRGVRVVAADGNQPGLPFADCSFELMTSRHPIVTWWDEVARVLRPSGTYLSQQVGPHSVRELSEALLGPLPPSSSRDPLAAKTAAEQAGLVVEDLRHERLRNVFYDIGAVVYFLRLVVWTVPGFNVELYRDQLQVVHNRIEREGGFVAHASRFLIEARKPG